MHFVGALCLLCYHVCCFFIATNAMSPVFCFRCLVAVVVLICCCCIVLILVLLRVVQVFFCILVWSMLSLFSVAIG